MYKEISKKVGDSPKKAERSVASEAVQKKAAKASGFLKPDQPNLFRDGGQSVVQEMKDLAAIQKGSLRKTAAENSDKKTHFRHMKAGEKIKDDKAFIASSRKKAIAKTEEQVINRINNELEAIGKKKKQTQSDRDRVAQLRKNDTGLPDDLKSGVESLSGLSMNDVKVHFNSPRPAQLHALAYTQGTDIHVAPGQEKHLAHEAWHVVQQKQGRVKPTTQMMDVSINDDTALEREADVMGAKAAVQGKADSAGVLYPSVNVASENIVQRRACLRCMCKAELDQIKSEGYFRSIGSKAKWCTIGEKTTEPNIKSYGDKNHDHLISFNIGEDIFGAHPIWYDEECDRPVESEHMNDIIGKHCEPGNIGLGCNLLPSIPVKPFDWTRKDKAKSSKPWERCR